MSERLAHVLWLGGSACSGKSSIAERVSNRFGHCVYDCDEAWFRHAEVASPTLQPVLHRLAGSDAEELWLRRTVARQVEDAIASYREIFPLILADIISMPEDTPVIVVGAALMPDLLTAAGIRLDRAMWLIPGQAFQRHQYEQRAWRHGILRNTSDPGRARENWMQRDAAFAREVARQAKDIGGRLVVVDDSKDLDAIEREVMDHYGIQ